MILVITTCCTRSTANSEAGGCIRGASKVLPPRLKTSSGGGGGGDGSIQPVAHPARMCHWPGSHAPLPASGKKRWLNCSEARCHPSNPVPGPTHHAGREGDGSGELALGIRRVPLAQFRSWSRQARGVPRPCKDNRFPTRAPAGTFKRSTRTPSGTPRSVSSRPRPTPGKRKSRKWDSEAATRGPPPGPDPQEGGCGPRQGLPGLRGPRRRRASAETEGAEAAWAWASRPAQERGPRARAVLATSVLAAGSLRIPARHQ